MNSFPPILSLYCFQVNLKSRYRRIILLAAIASRGSAAAAADISPPSFGRRLRTVGGSGGGGLGAPPSGVDAGDSEDDIPEETKFRT
jgi:hypothetical protein